MREANPDEVSDALRRLAEALHIDTTGSMWPQELVERVVEFGGDVVLRPDGSVQLGSVMDGEA